MIIKTIGKIKFISPKGYGFIIASETKEEFFFHYTGLVDQNWRYSILPEDPVSFNVEKNDRGLIATNIEQILT